MRTGRQSLNLILDCDYGETGKKAEKPRQNYEKIGQNAFKSRGFRKRLCMLLGENRDRSRLQNPRKQRKNTRILPVSCSPWGASRKLTKEGVLSKAIVGEGAYRAGLGLFAQ
jgi:hypothetical protein